MKNNDNVQKSLVNSKRNYGIDALRIVSMYMVIVLHIISRGGVSAATKEFSLQYEFAWLFNSITFCAVNCYALVSGYVGVTSKYKYSNLAVLWFRVVYYTVMITTIFAIVKPEVVAGRSWVKAIFPVMSGQYWYFTAYFAMFFFIPLLNCVLKQLNQKQMKSVICALIAIFSVLQTFTKQEVFNTGDGYSTWWLLVLYLVGGYIKKYGLFEKWSNKKLCIGFAVMVFGTWFTKFCIEFGSLHFMGHVRQGGFFVSYLSPTMLGEAVFLLLLFSRMRVGEKMEKIIKKMAPLAFSVYLLHVHPMVWDYVMVLRFEKYATYSWYLEIFAILGTAFLIYCFCSLVDLIREYIFIKMRLKNRLLDLEEKIVGNLWNNKE